METNRKDKKSTFFFDSAKIMDIVKSLKIDHNAVRFNLQTNTLRSDSDWSATHTILLTWDGPISMDDIEIIQSALHNAYWADFLNKNFHNFHTEGFPKPTWSLVNTYGWQSYYVLQRANNQGPDEDVAAYCTVTTTDSSLHITIIEPML